MHVNELVFKDKSHTVDSIGITRVFHDIESNFDIICKSIDAGLKRFTLSNIHVCQQLTR